jgi:phenylalanyl-tRNA synthetase beta chain
MKLPISWLKDFIDISDLSVEDIARKLTLAGLEVDEIRYVGLPMPDYSHGEKHEFKTTGIGWEKDKIVIAEIRGDAASQRRPVTLDLFDGMISTPC